MAVKIEDPAQDLYKKRRKELGINREVEPFTIASFIMIWFGIILSFIPIFGQLYVLLVLIFAIVGQVRINSNKEIYKGTGFNIFTIIVCSLYFLIIGIIFLFFISLLGNV